ncbi:MAG TPA: hypothetical protein VKX17_14870 [Planctomycetota bacterium]|nr:hypothetical protein [Planctomycetota bacterium]
MHSELSASPSAAVLTPQAAPPLEIPNDAAQIVEELGIADKVKPVYDILCEELGELDSAKLEAIPHDYFLLPRDVAFVVKSSLSYDEFKKRNTAFFFRIKSQFPEDVYLKLMSVLRTYG